MKFAIIIAALCIGLGAAHTQEEIERKGREIMEEYRRDRGHWIFLNSQGMVDHMVDHIGANGLAPPSTGTTRRQRANGHLPLRPESRTPCCCGTISLGKS